MAVLAAGIFVAQMLNFPIGGGTTGHLIGAALGDDPAGTVGGHAHHHRHPGHPGPGLRRRRADRPGAQYPEHGHHRAPGQPGRSSRASGRRTGPPACRWRRGPRCSWPSVVVAAQLALSYSLSGGAYGISGALAFPTMMRFHVAHRHRRGHHHRGHRAVPGQGVTGDAEHPHGRREDHGGLNMDRRYLIATVGSYPVLRRRSGRLLHGLRRAPGRPGQDRGAEWRRGGWRAGVQRSAELWRRTTCRP